MRPAGVGEPAGVLDRHDVVGAAVHEQPRPGRDAARGVDRIEVRDRADPRLRDRADSSAMRNTPVRRAYSRNQSGSRTQVRNDAGAANVAMPRTRSSSAAVTIASVPPSRKPGDPHAGDVAARVERVDRGAHVGEPAVDREVAFRRSGAAERERQARPSPPRARRDRTTSRRCSRARPRRPRRAGNPGSTSSAGTRVMPGGRAKCAPSRSPSERISSTCSHRRIESSSPVS